MASLPTTVKTPPSLSRAEHWTLHHVLFHRIEREVAEPDIEPPSVAVFRAFASLDVGETAFTETELEAIQSVLAEYHYSTDWWEVERAQLETLLYEVTQVRQIASHPEVI
ncbi:DUF7853 family protein [Halalkalicoccus salilacus]|uniref:DUF7853 family protein n=1 Tax=Halalkalicoccus salilacus TaxID=3117459 RepID=UPI00300F78AE